MSRRHRELALFAAVLGGCVAGFLAESLFGGRVLGPGDVVYAEASFRGQKPAGFEPANRLLMDPVLQFEPWLEFSRTMLRQGRLPLWNSRAGCGAPHLANGQSAVFDPFHLIAYFGRLPDARAWIAAAQLWIAGLGMFLLARDWRFGRWGRWFAGLAYPFCGFSICWLLYSIASVTPWLPWLLLASERFARRPTAPRAAGVAAAVAAVLLGGHAQVSAQVLIAGAAYVLWRRPSRLPAWLLPASLGVVVAAIEVVPLGFYLARSPVWADRSAEKVPAWTLTMPRWADAARTALPYAYGSHRRGMPNLARAVGAQNLNEAAGGYVGLAPLLWLAPLAWSARRRRPVARFLAGLVVVGACGAFDVPPVANLLRALPVLDVADNRRLTLWVAFGLVALGGLGLDQIARTRALPVGRLWVKGWLTLAVLLAVAAICLPALRPKLEARARAYYQQAAESTPGASPDELRSRAIDQVDRALVFLPRYYLLVAGELVALAALAQAHHRGAIGSRTTRRALVGLTAVELIGFGFGLNPAIPRDDDRPVSEVIAHLQREAPPPARVLAIGTELPPNLLMRYGLADCRNYDSIELARSLDWFEPLYEPEFRRKRAVHHSRRTITWAGVLRARDHLRAAGVTHVVGAERPPDGAFEHVETVGAVWVARLGSPASAAGGDGVLSLDVRAEAGRRKIIAETYDPGWKAEVDGRSLAVTPERGTFLAIDLPPDAQRLVIRYDPPEVRAALGASALGVALIGGLMVRGWPRIRGRKTGFGSWSGSRCRDRIRPVVSSRPFSRPAQLEGTRR